MKTSEQVKAEFWERVAEAGEPESGVLAVSCTSAGGGLRARREQAGISLATVAKAIGVSVPFLSDLERGRRAVSAGRAAQISLVLNNEADAVRMVCRALDESRGRVSVDLGEMSDALQYRVAETIVQWVREQATGVKS